MIARQQDQPVWQLVAGPMRERVIGLPLDNTSVPQVSHIPVKRYLPQTENNLHPRQGLNLRGQVLGAVAHLNGRGFVAGRSAPHDRRDPDVPQTETIVNMGRIGPASQANVMQYRVHKVPCPIAGKRASRAIGPMCAGGKAEDEDTRPGIAEAWHGTGPIRLIHIGTALLFPNVTAVVAQTGTAIAIGDGLIDLKKLRRCELSFRGLHCIP